MFCLPKMDVSRQYKLINAVQEFDALHALWAHPSPNLAAAADLIWLNDAP